MAVSVNVSETINEMLTQSPDLKLKQLAALKPNLKYNAVKTAYYRWQRIHNPKPKKKKGRKVSKKMKTKETSKKSEETTDVNPLLSPELTFDYLKFIWQQKSINNSKVSDAMLKMGIDLIDKEYKYKKTLNEEASEEIEEETLNMEAFKLHAEDSLQPNAHEIKESIR